MLVGYLFPDKGRVTINGKNIKNNPEKIRKNIGYMPESNPIYKDMRVDELLKFVLSLHEIPKNEWDERIDKVVNSIGIKEVYFRPIGELSKGYKQRVGLAQAMVHDPEILILDEPTEGLDPNQRSSIRKLIKEIGKKKTVILSTHVMQEVAAMCDRVLIINKGRLVADGKPEELSDEGKANKVIVTIKGKDILKKVEKLKEVKKVKDLTKENSKGMSTMAVYYDGEDSFFGRFSTLVSQNAWVIYEMKREEVSLEDIFYKLTK
jgi:ABC-2 type transport system ATP-binding protein